MAENARLVEDKTREKNWKRWGPYLSERQWGTVREDYSPDGNCWDYFPHDHARSRAYRWGEDGLLGVTDRQCRLCLSLALWNGVDPILKERLFGLTGPQGNHGEDVKELYYYLDSTPTHSYMKALYKYPQDGYPYSQIIDGNSQRGVHDPEFEVEDTGVFREDRYWDVFAEYAKAGANDLLCRYTVCNRGSETATLHVIPQLWFRNTWIWGCTHEGCTLKPKIKRNGEGKVSCKHESLGLYEFEVDVGQDGKLPHLMMTENETNSKKLYGTDQYTPYVRDAFHRYVVDGDRAAITPGAHGTKVGAHYVVTVPAGQTAVIQCRLYDTKEKPETCFGQAFDEIFTARKQEADEFYGQVIQNKDAEEQLVARQAYAGLLWSKQFYHYIVKDWLLGDRDQPPPPHERLTGRNHEWAIHLFNKDVISMPDKWEYPWYASWDLAFHMVPFANVDIEFAKDQLLLFLREWYMHPNGQIPAYEFAFEDVNPPVHAFAVLAVWRKTGPRGQRDMAFLAKCFQKLVLNFTWWVNRKDPEGRNLFAGGFLGLDNIGVFDRSKPLPTGGHLEQADGTAWMAFFAVCMLDIALELAAHDHVYEDMASKFFEHFITITDAMNKLNDEGLWDEQDGFFYDHLRLGDMSCPLKVRSMVGLVPLFSCLVLEEERIKKLEGFVKRTNWFVKNRPDLSSRISFMAKQEGIPRALLALVKENQLKQVLKYLLDENEFLSPYGIRSLSKVHQDKPFVIHVNGEEHRVDYVPGESNTYLFGGNSNWRGPIWLCMNYLVIRVLRRYHYYYSDDFKVECPTGSGKLMTLEEISDELGERLNRLFLPDAKGHRPCHGGAEKYANDSFWKDLILFYEYFDGNTGRGCGASHQTGWTAVVAKTLERVVEKEQKAKK